MPAGYTVQALNLFDVISIKAIRSLLTGKVIFSSPQEMQLQYAENSYLFVYRFGCLVFFNMTNEEIDRETTKLRSALGSQNEFPTTESYVVNVGDFAARVEFDYMELKRLTLDHLRVIAMSLGQSAALEYYELKADRMLRDTSSFMQSLAEDGASSFRTKTLLQIIGSTAFTRQHIISNLAILDPPEETWKNKELERLYRDLQQNFDIEIRFRTLDRKMSLLQDNIEILADLTSKRRTNLLEMSIVLLILLEIILAVIQRA